MTRKVSCPRNSRSDTSLPTRLLNNVNAFERLSQQFFLEFVRELDIEQRCANSDDRVKFLGFPLVGIYRDETPCKIAVVHNESVSSSQTPMMMKQNGEVS